MAIFVWNVEFFYFIQIQLPMYKPSTTFSQSGTASAFKPYIVPSVRIVSFSLVNALLLTSTNSGEIEPGTDDDWGDF